MSRYVRFAIAGAITVLVTRGTVYAQLQVYAAQSEPAHSFIAGWGGEIITDTEFAQIAAPLFVKNGHSNTYGASFFFQECYSGGMFNDLETTISDKVPWVGGYETGTQLVEFMRCAILTFHGEKSSSRSRRMDLSCTQPIGGTDADVADTEGLCRI